MISIDCFRKFLSVGLLALLAAAVDRAEAQEVKAATPHFIDAKAAKDRFDQITPKEIEQLRGLRILVASKSLGLNLMKGFGHLAKDDPAWKLSVQRFDVEKKGGLPVVPADAFNEPGIVHIMATRYPLHQRVQEVDDLLRKAPWNFADKVDAVVIIYSAVKPETFADYAKIMDGLRTDFPKILFIQTTAALNGAGAKDAENVSMHAFSELMRKAYRGKAPVYDLGAILSQDFRLGPLMVPEYTKDPTGVHPNLVPGESAAKGLALTLREGLSGVEHHCPAGCYREHEQEIGMRQSFIRHTSYQLSLIAMLLCAGSHCMFRSAD
jgi:hypothetical protein